MQDDCTGPRVARDAIVLGSGGSLDQGTPTAPSLEDTTETTTFQQIPQQRGVPESTHLRWQKQLRHLKGNPQEKSINQGGPFMGDGAHRIRWTSPQQLFPR